MARTHFRQLQFPPPPGRRQSATRPSHPASRRHNSVGWSTLHPQVHHTMRRCRLHRRRSVRPTTRLNSFRRRLGVRHTILRCRLHHRRSVRTLTRPQLLPSPPQFLSPPPPSRESGKGAISFKAAQPARHQRVWAPLRFHALRGRRPPPPAPPVCGRRPRGRRRSHQGVRLLLGL